MTKEEVLAAHSLLRHVAPKDIEDKLFDTLALNSNLADDLLATIDIPFQIGNDPENRRPFIKCDYNRDLDSYRSPYSNKYVPNLPDGLLPPERLRNMEVTAEKALAQYRLLYYDKGGVSSTYCWELENGSFGFGLFVKKEIEDEMDDGKYVKGSINSSDVIRVTPNEENNNQTFKYHLISSVLLYLTVEVEDATEPLVISGTAGDEETQEREAEDDIGHLVNILSMIEEKNAKFMAKVETIYVAKMLEILSRSRTLKGQSPPV